MKKYLIIGISLFPAVQLWGQESPKGVIKTFAGPIITDSSSTILIPTLYDARFFTSNKMALWGDFYANIIFYNFKTDSSKRLFEKDTYIANFNKIDYSWYAERKPKKNTTAELIFYRVMNVDRNKSGKIDSQDPAILYVSDIHGNGLRRLSSPDENVVSIDLYEKQNLALVKVQRDQNNDGDFTWKDADYYYVRLDLESLGLGNKIELR